MTVNDQSQFVERFNQGKVSFDRGQYRQSIAEFEAALKLITVGSKQGGEAQLWLAMAYQAAGDTDTAKQLCRKLIRHPHPDCRKQSQQVLAILQAPQLARPAEWMTPIPDLTNQENVRPVTAQMRRPRRPKPEPSPIQFEDTRRMNTRDNGFILAAIALIVLLLGATYWLS
jgi:tetratricopeptide (TPR) repeat protein